MVYHRGNLEQEYVGSECKNITLKSHIPNFIVSQKYGAYFIQVSQINIYYIHYIMIHYYYYYYYHYYYYYYYFII